MKVSAITLNGINTYDQIQQNKRNLSRSISPNKYRNIDNFALIPVYQIPFTSIQNSSK